MKKFVFVFAFAVIATLSFAAVNTAVKANPVVIENTDEKPKKDEKKAEAKDEKKADTKTAAKKSSCSSAEKKACCKKK